MIAYNFSNPSCCYRHKSLKRRFSSSIQVTKQFYNLKCLSEIQNKGGDSEMCVAIANGNCPGKKTWTCDVNFEKNLPSWMQSKQNPLTNENIDTFDKILFIFSVEFKVISYIKIRRV